MIETELEAASLIAGDRIYVLRQFTDNLVTHGENLGLIGPRELERIWTRHILNSALLAPFIKTGGRVADIGTGGGMPGLILAIIRPDAQFRFIEPMERRCVWLNEQIAELRLTNAIVQRARAEEVHGAFEVDQVTARAVTALSKLIPIAAPLVGKGGELLFLKGQSVHAEVEAAAKQIRKYRLHNITIEELGAEMLIETTQLFRAQIA